MFFQPLLQVKSRQGERTDLCQKSDKSEKPNLDTKKELARAAGVSHDTIAKGKVIEAKASESQAVRFRRSLPNRLLKTAKNSPGGYNLPAHSTGCVWRPPGGLPDGPRGRGGNKPQLFTN